METVGNSQKSGIDRGWGYEDSACGALDFSWRKPSRCSSLSRSSRYARA
ncbi:hypothetical protein STENM327S_02058 [Streptomyces tendae]